MEKVVSGVRHASEWKKQVGKPRGKTKLNLPKIYVPSSEHLSQIMSSDGIQKSMYEYE